MADAPEVNLVSDSAPNLLLGKFEEGEVTLPSPELGGAKPNEAKVYLDAFDLDIPGSVLTGEIESEGPLSGRLWMELSEVEVARLATFSGASGTFAAAPVKSVRFE